MGEETIEEQENTVPAWSRKTGIYDPQTNFRFHEANFLKVTFIPFPKYR
jgi:hypothetical protein